MGEVWTVKAALDWCQGYLERHNDENPRLSAQWLLAFATGLSRIEVYVNYDKPLSLAERDVLRDAVRRRAAGEPLQYIQGEAPFRHLMVKVRSGVLIPRPETEMLVELALSQVDERAAACAEQGRLVDVVDCCTGSGCIACSLATERANVRVLATDISPIAVEVARENRASCVRAEERRRRVREASLDDAADTAYDATDSATASATDGAMVNVADGATARAANDATAGVPDGAAIAARLSVVECDLFAAVDDASADVVVSNPPYIPDVVMAELPSEVSCHEPELALAGGNDGLDVFRRMLPEMMRVLRSGGAFACELHETCLASAAALAEAAGFQRVRIENDLTGRTRFLTAVRP